MSTALDVQNLTVTVRRGDQRFNAVESVSFSVDAGEAFGIVGESGSGKSLTLRAIMALLPGSARLGHGDIVFEGRELAAKGRAARDERRGCMTMVFQDPLSALNPVRTIGRQIAEVPRRVLKRSRSESRQRAIELLGLVGVPDPVGRFSAYPHQLSGGMRQRVGIAIALACAPRLLIADEPTTGLDVTTQAAILDLLRDMATRRGVGIVLITHDLALAWSVCDRVAVMHAGHVVETAPTEALFGRPRHPYSAGLMRSAPSAVTSIEALEPIAGQSPDLRRADLPPCRFSERCARHQAVCDAPGLTRQTMGPDHVVLCRRPL